MRQKTVLLQTIKKNKTGRAIGSSGGTVFFLERWSGKSSLKGYPPGETPNEVREGAMQISGVRAFQTGEEHVQRPWGQTS